jgi:hypothetical protein
LGVIVQHPGNEAQTYAIKVVYITWEPSPESIPFFSPNQHHLLLQFQPTLQTNPLYAILSTANSTANMKATVPTALLAMEAATVLAAPFTERNSLFARQGGNYLHGPVDGDSTIEYGDSKLNYGARVPSTILDIIRDECLDTACNPGGDYGFSTLVINADRASDVSYSINIEGSFANPGERGDKTQLLQLAKLAFEEVYNAGVATRRQGVIYITGECPAWQTNGCPGSYSQDLNDPFISRDANAMLAGQDVDYADQWESISHVNVRIEDEEGTLKGFLNVGITMDDSSLGSGICASLGAAGITTAFVSSVAAAGFSLASVVCGTL